MSRPGTVTVITLALTALAATQFHRVYFDYDLLNMQSAGLPAVVYEEKLIHGTPQSVLFAAVIADTPQQALELEARLRKLPSVSTNISMAQYLTGDVTEKLKLIGEIKQEIAPVEFQPPDTAPVNLEQLEPHALFHGGLHGRRRRRSPAGRTRRALPSRLRRRSNQSPTLPATIAKLPAATPPAAGTTNTVWPPNCWRFAPTFSTCAARC